MMKPDPSAAATASSLRISTRNRHRAATASRWEEEWWLGTGTEGFVGTSLKNESFQVKIILSVYVLIDYA